MKYCADVKEPMKSFSSDVIVGTGFAMSNLNISKKKKFDSERTKYDLFSVDLRQPQVHSKHLGKIIDNKKKLSEDCNGREIKTQLCKVGDDYRWVVIELL